MTNVSGDSGNYGADSAQIRKHFPVLVAGNFATRVADLQDLARRSSAGRNAGSPAREPSHGPNHKPDDADNDRDVEDQPEQTKAVTAHHSITHHLDRSS